MSVVSNVARLVQALLSFAAVLAVAGCANLSGKTRAIDPAKIQALGTELEWLAPKIRPDEARNLAACAYESSRQLAIEYRVVPPALWQNVLVNFGFRKRGLCYQWAEDLFARLQELDLTTLELHWGVARQGTFREHNCVVVTARGQPFETGIALDAWRHSGRLVWKPVTDDHYPWKEGELPSPTSKTTD